MGTVLIHAQRRPFGVNGGVGRDHVISQWLAMSSAALLPEPQGAASPTPPARARRRLPVFVGQAWAGDRQVGQVGRGR